MEDSYVTIIRALNSPIRRRVLQFSSDGAYSINELVEKFTKSNIEFGSRDSLYKQAELLVNAGLLEKFYDVNKKAISYKNLIVQLVIDIEHHNVEKMQEEKIVTM